MNKDIKSEKTLSPSHALPENGTTRGHGSYTLRKDVLAKIEKDAHDKQVSRSAIVEKILVKNYKL